MKGASGNAVIGSIRSGMIKTMLLTWITFTITLLNMVMHVRSVIGRFRLFGIMSKWDYILKIGQVMILIFMWVSRDKAYIRRITFH